VRARRPLERVDVVQPVLWAIMVSLAEVWRAHGVRPAAVIGHSQGEIAAACVAGALSLADGARVVALRSRAIAEDLSGRGGMMSVALPEARVRELIAPYGDGVSVAAVNGASSVVLSGDADALDELRDTIVADGARAKRLPVDYASHGAHVESIRERLLTDLAGIEARAAEVPFYSTVTGGLYDTTGLDATYWYTNLRQSVLFAPTTRTLLDGGYGVFVECSPHPVLLHSIEETADAAGADVTGLGSLRRDDGGPDRVLASLGEAFVAGIPVDWSQAFAGTPVRAAELPTYPFQRERFWLGHSPATGDVTAAGLSATGHPLLGAAVPVAGGGTLFTGRLTAATAPWLADHAVGGTVLLPGTAFVELALGAGHDLGCGHVTELTLQAPLVLPAQGAVQLQLHVAATDDTGHRALTVHSRPEGADDGGWTLHASGLLAPQTAAPDFDLAAWPPTDAVPLPVDDAYEELAALGYDYGPAFQGLRAAWRRATRPSPSSNCPSTPTGSPCTLRSSTRPCTPTGSAPGSRTAPGCPSSGTASRCTPPGPPHSGYASRAATPSPSSSPTPPAPRSPPSTAWSPGPSTRPPSRARPAPTTCTAWTGPHGPYRSGPTSRPSYWTTNTASPPWTPCPTG
jgi:acyl transferase domain-containing protein